MTRPAPTWDEVRARSEEVIGGMKCFCWDCDLVYPSSGLPCRKHATPEESAAIDELIMRTLSGTKLE